MGVVVLYVLGVNNRSFMAFARCVISRSHLHLSISASTIPPSSASLLAFENSCIQTYKELRVFMNEHNNSILLVHVPDVFAYVCIRCRHVLGNGDSPFIYQGGVYTQQFRHCTDNNIFTVVVRYTIYNIQYTIYTTHFIRLSTSFIFSFNSFVLDVGFKDEDVEHASHSTFNFFVSSSRATLDTSSCSFASSQDVFNVQIYFHSVRIRWVVMGTIRSILVCIGMINIPILLVLL